MQMKQWPTDFNGVIRDIFCFSVQINSNFPVSFTYFCCYLLLFSYGLEKLADEPVPVVKKPVVVANVNKWEGEDEDDVKVSKCSNNIVWHAYVCVCVCECVRVMLNFYYSISLLFNFGRSVVRLIVSSIQVLL